MNSMYGRMLQCGLLVILISGCSQVSSYEEARDSLFKDLAGIEGSQQAQVQPVPDLYVGRPYEVGEVYTVSSWPGASTPECKKNVDKHEFVMTASPSLQNGNEFSGSVQPPTLLQRAFAEVADFKASASKKNSLYLSYEPTTHSEIKALRPFLDTLSKDVNCLANVSNKSIFIITNVISMKQSFKSSRAVEASAGLKLFKTDAFDLKYGNNGEFVLTDSVAAPRALLVREFRFDIQGLDPDQAVAAKQDFIRRVLSNESTDGTNPVDIVELTNPSEAAPLPVK